MNEKFDINRIRVATPCPASWENMVGDERKRFCASCSLNVYNISKMTAPEVQALIANSTGRVCGRVYRRADGTVITRDCPTGLANYRKRISRFAGATLAAVLGLFSIGYGQEGTETEDGVVLASQLKIKKTLDHSGKSSLAGTVMDENEAVIPGMALVLVRKADLKIYRGGTDENGEYSFTGLETGTYTLTVEGRSGFLTKKVKDIEIGPVERNDMDVTLFAAELGGVIVTGDLVTEIDPVKTDVQPEPRSPEQPKKP